MRSIAVVTVSRSDYGIYLPILRAIEGDPLLRLQLIVAAEHLVPELGLTVRQIEADGFAVAERVEMVMASDSAEGAVKSMGVGLIGFAQVFARSRPDLLIVLGDRTEMHTAGLAALPFTIPVAHIHGGEVSYGAIDDALRHSLTKLSHLHFVSTESHAARVIQMGEEPRRVVVSGAPALDRLTAFQPLSRETLVDRYGVSMSPAPLLVTFHPATLEPDHVDAQCEELIAALARVNRPVIFTAPNADPGGHAIRAQLDDYVRHRADAWLIENAGNDGYYSLMTYAAAMVGNSSSALIEAPSFRLPAVNIGLRQQGRLRARNVIDVGSDREAILAGIGQALAPGFRASLSDLQNPYGKGHAASVIVDVLKTIPLGDALIRKQFWEPLIAPLTTSAG